jgi:hypothetical protein
MGMVVHACNTSTKEAEAEGPQVCNQLELLIEFKASLGYILKLCFKTSKQKK